MQKNKIIVILGSTASGKSEVAVKIARSALGGNGEIISADSRQVYKGLDIGTAKVKGKWKSYPDKNKRSSKIVRMGKIKKVLRKVFVYKGIPHYCLDIVSLKKIFTAMDFKKCAQKAINDILARGKTPIICGGTGFYISVITGGINIPEVKPDWRLRKKLEKKSTEELFKMLRKLNPKRAKNIDPKNPRRLIRAIEIAKTLGKIPELKPGFDYERLMIGTKLSEKELKKRIEKRVKRMFNPPAGGGLIKEIKKLRKQGLSWKRFYELGFEYKYPAMFLQKKIRKEEMLKRIILENWHYVKRQMTWFKRDKKIEWLSNYKQAEKSVREFIK